MEVSRILVDLDRGRTQLNKALIRSQSRPGWTVGRLNGLRQLVEDMESVQTSTREALEAVAGREEASYVELLWAAEVYEAMQQAAECVLELAADIINDLEGPKNGTFLRARSKLKRMPVHPVEAAAPWDPLEGDFPSYEGGCSCETCTGPIDDDAGDNPVGALTDGSDDAPDVARAANE